MGTQLGGIISSKASVAHAKAMVDDKHSDFLLPWILRGWERRRESLSAGALGTELAEARPPRVLFFFNLVIYLTVQGLSCSMRDLLLQHVGSLVAACGI